MRPPTPPRAVVRWVHAAAIMLAVGPVIRPGGPAAAAPQPFAAVCPKAPPGVQGFADEVTAWVKWGVLALLAIGAVVSLGSILVGRIFAHPHAARYGAMGVAVVVMVAITYTVILVIRGSITGSGCT
jgi:hypothetical protein